MTKELNKVLKKNKLKIEKHYLSSSHKKALEDVIQYLKKEHKKKYQT